MFANAQQHVTKIVVLLVGLAILFMWRSSRSPEAPTMDVVSALAIEGSSVEIPTATLLRDGFVVVREAQEGFWGEALGVSELLRAGVHEGLTISLERPVRAGEELFVVIAHDDGDGLFDWMADTAALDAAGEVVFMLAPVFSQEEFEKLEALHGD